MSRIFNFAIIFSVLINLSVNASEVTGFDVDVIDEVPVLISRDQEVEKLLEAISNDDAAAVRNIFKEVPNLENSQTSLGSLLGVAAFLGAVNVLKELIFRRQIAINGTDREGNTPLHLAVAAGNLGAVKLLLYNGANPRLINDRNETPAKICIVNRNSCAFFGHILRHLFEGLDGCYDKRNFW